MASCESTGGELSFEWSHHTISSIESKVTVTLHNPIKHSVKGLIWTNLVPRVLSYPTNGTRERESIPFQRRRAKEKRMLSQATSYTFH